MYLKQAFQSLLDSHRLTQVHNGIEEEKFKDEKFNQNAGLFWCADKLRKPATRITLILKAKTASITLFSPLNVTSWSGNKLIGNN